MFGKKLIGTLAFLFLIVMTTSCEVDPDVVDGQQDEVAKFLGTWSVSDQPARLNYYVTIERDPVYENQVFLQNFADAGDKAIGLVSGNRIVIDKQSIGSGYSTSGEGLYISAKSLSFEFLLDDGIDNDLRKATFVK
jgi:hypothetical protein